MTTHDRAAELWAMPDMWRAIQPWLVLAAENAANDARWFALDLDDYTGPGVEAELRRKFAAGEAEHGRDWLHMTQDQVREEIRNELRDLVLYHAMILARWQDTPDDAVSVPPFTTNADPGDEQADAS